MPELIHPADDVNVDVVEPPPSEPTDAPRPEPRPLDAIRFAEDRVIVEGAQTTPQAPTQEDQMDTTPTPDDANVKTGFFPITWGRYRKAVGAAVGAALASFPVVGIIVGDVTDYRTALAAAINAAGAALMAILFPKNEA